MAHLLRHKSRSKKSHRVAQPTLTIKRFKTEGAADSYRAKMWGKYDIDIDSTTTVRPKFMHGDKVGVTVLAGVKKPAVLIVKKPGAKVVNPNLSASKPTHNCSKPKAKRKQHKTQPKPRQAETIQDLFS